MTFIYALVDPRDNQVRYVGKSNYPRLRLASHAYEARRGRKSYKLNWVRLLSSLGQRPKLILLAQVPADNWEVFERAYIEAFGGIGTLTNTLKGGEAQPPVHCVPHPGFINQRTGRTIPAGVGLKPKAIALGISEGALREIAVGKRISYNGWVLDDVAAVAARIKLSHEKLSAAQRGNQKAKGHTNFKNGKGYHTSESRMKTSATMKARGQNEGQRRGIQLAAESRIKSYPAFLNEVTGEIIPPGRNLLALCKSHNLSGSHMRGIVKGKRRMHKNWVLANGIS